MELLNNDKKWFLSDEGSKLFATLDNVNDRAVFIYSYLKSFSNEVFEKENILFKTAFLLADAVFNSQVAYSSFPKILDEKVNPFVAFFANAKREYTQEQIYCIFLSFIHNVADPFKKTDWIYNDSSFKDNEYLNKLNDEGRLFFVPNETLLPEKDAFKCEEVYNMIQLEIIWLFLKNREV